MITFFKGDAAMKNINTVTITIMDTKLFFKKKGPLQGI